MGLQDDSARRSPFSKSIMDQQSSARTVPILQLTTNNRQSPVPSGDPMDITPSSTLPMGPPSRTSPEDEANGANDHMAMVQMDHGHVNLQGPNAAAAAAAGAQQPKVVQTAFIHKLYNMLEDPSIQHLISWSASAESFVMSPSNDFSKVLSQYFKHTNISSFVRQLNMYGFHKVSDVFHTGSPESPLWEFKHGQGNFKRGDLVGLREIKRRASRHALVHREAYSASKPTITLPGTPAEPMHALQESTDSRLTQLEHTLYDMHARLARTEENCQFLHVKNQVATECLSRSLQVHMELSRAVLSLVPNPETPIHRDLMNIQGEIQRQAEVLRSLDEPPDAFASRAYFGNLSLENAPVSPRQLPMDDPRRQQQQVMMNVPQPRQNFYRPPVPSHLSAGPRRYCSFGTGTSGSSPTAANTPRQPPPLQQQQQQPPPPHPLPVSQSPPSGLSRRHTSADIRAHGWQPSPNERPSPFNSGQSSGHYPSSPKRSLHPNENHQIRESLSSYSLNTQAHSHSGPTTPPLTNGSSVESLGSWSWQQNKGGSLFGGLGRAGGDSSGPPTRRGSMAHILNPAETAERDEEAQDEMREDDRKRKRLQ